MIAGHYKLKQLLAEGKLIIKPISHHTVREAGLDLRLGDQYTLLTSPPLQKTANPQIYIPPFTS